MQRKKQHSIGSLSELLAYEAELDRAVCGLSLGEDHETRLAQQGAHDATPTPHFVLDELFGQVTFDESTHLLDVGCSTGRVLAHFVSKGLPGHATGIELDPELAAVAQQWTGRFPNVDVIQGSVLDLDLDSYNLFYLFNPFEPHILEAFIEELEAQLTHPFTLIHMSDNGDRWRYESRPGWTQLAVGSFLHFRDARGFKIQVYDWPQRYSIWRHE